MKTTNSAYTTRQIDFSLENGLICFNTKFKKRKRKLWTYTCPINAKTQIYYILMNKKWITSDLNFKAYSSLESVAINHQIVTAKTCLSLHRNMMQTTKTTHYDWSLINNRDKILAINI